jgi:hypothetical protein
MGSIALRIGKTVWIYDYAFFFRPPSSIAT